MSDLSEYWSRRPINRRRFIGGAAAGGLGFAAILAGCGDDDDSPTASATAAGTAAGTSSTSGSTATATATADASAPRDSGGTLSYGMQFTEVDYVSPRKSHLANNQNFFSIIGDPLIYLGADGEHNLDWSLLESVEVADPTTITAKVRQNVQFHDGTPLTAEAIKAQVEYLLDAEKAPSFTFRPTISAIEQVEANGDADITFKLSQPDAGLLTALGTNAGWIFSVEEAERSGDAELLAPVMTGPYKVDKVDIGVRRSYTRNDNYWQKAAGGPPYLDTIVREEIPDSEARAAALETGQLHVAQFVANQTSRRLTDEGDLQSRSYLGFGIAPFLNINLAPFDDHRVRQALVHSLNKELVVQILYLGQGNVMTGWAFPGMAGHVDHEPYPYNPAEARKLLEATGLAMPLKVDLAYSMAGTNEQAATIYQQGMNESGFDVTLQGMQTAEIQKALWDDLTLPLGIPTGIGPRADPGLQLQLSLGSNARFNPSREATLPEVARIGELLDQGRSEFDSAARVGIYEEAQRIALDLVYAQVPVACYDEYVFAANNVGGVDNPEFTNLAAGPGFRLRLNWLTEA